MRSWTTPLKVTAIAAGLAAIGTGTAAADTSGIAKPDLSQVPDTIGFTAPVNACGMQQDPSFNSVKAPCVDGELHASAPNVVKKVGADITTTAHGVAGELNDGHSPLTPGKATRVLGHVGAEELRLAQMTNIRPNVGVHATPQHTGIVDEHKPAGEFLDAEIGPRGKQHEGVSGLDTAVDLGVAHGYTVRPLATPAGPINKLTSSNPLNDHVTVPKVADAVPPAGRMPVLAEVDNGLHSGGQRTADAVTDHVPDVPVDKLARNVRMVGDLAADSLHR